MIDPETSANKAVWYITGHSDCAAVFAALDERSAAIRGHRVRGRAVALRHARDRGAVGLDAQVTVPDPAPLAFIVRRIGERWGIGLPCDPTLPAALKGLIGPPTPSPGHHTGGEITWTLAEIPASEAEAGAPEPAAIEFEERVERVLADLLERASRRGAFGPEHHPREILAWCLTRAGQAAQARARSQIAALLSRSDRPIPPAMGTARIGRGSHLPRRTLAERLRIAPVSHEGRCDAVGDWGGPRRILAQTSDRARRLFISEGHSRSLAGKRRGGYTPASLWIQGDASGGLFAKNVVIYRGRVTRDVLVELTPRIESGLDCPGLGAFLALYHTVTVEPET